MLNGIEVNTIRFLFWNIYKRNLIYPILSLIREQDVDIVALVEAKQLDVEVLLSSLKQHNHRWKVVEVFSDRDICLIAKNGINIIPHKEEKHYHIYKIKLQNEIWLFHIVHLSSAMYHDEYARNRLAIKVSQMLEKEEEFFFGDGVYKSIVVGDFNLQPYSDGLLGMDSFNAVMSTIKAREVKRRYEGIDYNFYYNPMWKLMGDNKLVQGTYYSNHDNRGNSVFWYTFDQVLIRPYFIDMFHWDSFEIIESTKKLKFVTHRKIDKKQYSDHLPLKFEIYPLAKLIFENMA